ncbi:M23 family metallopeptidase [Streptomyces lasiicapitis]|uniref:Peptidase n=1 Tax=Streptomyces lasiicapitis TaxID=1923961 RepID=A0ABQ2LKA8_9ACTN|nr:M23 family metallopeptidase [Streptomyces lasiicapitis]GGO38310.1 peptidase [Streptomyces lasiicapitis]
MAFTRPTGKHRRPSRISRTTASAAGVAALTTTGVISGLAAPAFAAEAASAPEHKTTGLTQSISIGDSLADEIDAQAAAQKQAALEAAAKAKAEAAAKAKAEEAKRKAAEAKRKAEAAAKAKAKEEREAKERAAREAERKRLMGSYVAPVDGSYVSTGYQTGGAMWSSGSHTGVDFHAASGTEVQAVAAGTVVEAGWGGAYGNNVVIRHNDGTYTQYGHMSSLSVTVGQAVTPGQQIGLSGSTGNSSGPHLHFEARTGADYGSDIDPVAYLRSHGVSV